MVLGVRVVPLVQADLSPFPWTRRYRSSLGRSWPGLAEVAAVAEGKERGRVSTVTYTIGNSLSLTFHTHCCPESFLYEMSPMQFNADSVGLKV